MTDSGFDLEAYVKREKLISRGIYDEAIATSLREEKEQDLHSDVHRGLHKEYNAILFYPANYNSVMKCSILAQLYVKELYDLKHPTYAVPLRGYTAAMNEERTWILDETKFLPTARKPAKHRRVFYMEDFYDKRIYDCAPWSKKEVLEQQTIEKYLMFRMRSCRDLLVLHSEEDPEYVDKGWSTIFMKYLMNNCKIIKVTA